MLRNKTTGKMVKGLIVWMDVWTILFSVGGVKYTFPRADWEIVLIDR